METTINLSVTQHFDLLMLWLWKARPDSFLMFKKKPQKTTATSLDIMLTTMAGFLLSAGE